MPSSRAVARLEALRPIPTTVSTAFARFSASAKEPPISPTPTTSTFASLAACTASALFRGCIAKRVPQRGKEACVFFLETDRHAQVPGQSVVGDRPHDHPLAQQLVVDLCGVP